MGCGQAVDVVRLMAECSMPFYESTKEGSRSTEGVRPKRSSGEPIIKGTKELEGNRALVWRVVW